MEIRTASDDQAKPGGRTIAVYSNGSWSVVYSEDENCLYIHAEDYHAGPLRIDRALAVQIESAFPPCARAVAEPGGPFVTLNRKDRCAEIEIAEGWSGVIKLSRKELYRLGKKLAKRTRYIKHKSK